ncbi:hypothetical protein GQ43DRAFT_470465 [Delitschia confertaspora ATCC 74209]|uniref:RBR-type E3 ubiquitin transferase n=1 Tax=Delitschia confertaspora ATCC 74209 TaxID=1513339 RepID=A0A9P4JNQ3_9PLEO|nr:hypothetical protein GQ43DRAFT_470465 [Delitschia confertaspora ATCC 74209]
MAPTTRLQADPNRARSYANLNSKRPSNRQAAPATEQVSLPVPTAITRAPPLPVVSLPASVATMRDLRRPVALISEPAATTGASLLSIIRLPASDATTKTPRRPTAAVNASLTRRVAPSASAAGPITLATTDVTNPPRKKAKIEKANTKNCFLCRDDLPLETFPVQAGHMCNHFNHTCKPCVGKWLEMFLGFHRLNGGNLPCGWCSNGNMEFHLLEDIVGKELFERWDKAILQQSLSSNDDIIPCLNLKCGAQFSFEGCIPEDNETNEGKGKKVACPHCKSQVCLLCGRPWHEGTGCDQKKLGEDKLAVQTIEKKIGAKQCPNCGIRIEKTQGCDHMQCSQCNCNFCWKCLGSDKKHKLGCSNLVPIDWD